MRHSLKIMVKLFTLLALFIFTTATSAYAGWYNSNWDYRKSITLSSSMTPSTQTNFPVLVSVTDTGLRDNAQADGDDILLTSSDETTKLSHEIESFNSATGELTAWVKIPSLSGSADTTIYIYYGNGSASNQQDVANVWDSSFKGVWHLKEDPSGTSPQVADSTSNNNDGTSGSTMTAGDRISGKIDRSLDFDGGDNDYVSIASNSGLNPAAITLETWVYFDSIGTRMDFVSKNQDVPTQGYGLFKEAGNTIIFSVWDGSTWQDLAGTTAVSAGQWYHIAGVLDSNGTKIYVNATQENSSSSVTSYVTGTQDLKFGRHSAEMIYNFDGRLDEVRITNIARSADWIKTAYNNQNSPGSYLTFGSQQANISGSIYSDEGTTKITAGTTVHLVINGVSDGTNTTTTGDYSITTSGLSAGDKVLVYIDNHGTNDGNTVTVSDGNSLAGLDIYKDRVIVRQDNGGSLTNADMGSAWISDAGDIFYSVSGGELTVSGATTELYVPTGHTFTPGGNVTTTHVKVAGAMNGGANTFTVSGDWDSSTGIFNYDTCTLKMTGTGKTLKHAGGWADRLYNLTVANGASVTHTGGVSGIANDITIEDNATLLLTSHTFRSKDSGTGRLTIGTGATLDIKYKFYHYITDGSSHISSTGTIKSTNGTGVFYYAALSGNTAAPVTARSYDLDVAVTGATDAVFVIGGGASLNLGGHNLYLWDTGQLGPPFGTLDNSSNIPIVSTGTLEIADRWDNAAYTGKLIARSADYQFGSVILRNSGQLDCITGSGASTWTVSGNVTMNNGSSFSAGGSTWNIGGSWVRNGGTFTADSSTVVLNGTGQAINGSTTFNNLTKSVASADTLTFEAGETTAINGTVTLNGASGQLLTLASSTGSSAWNFTVNAGATKAIDYVSVSWSDASGSDATRKPINPTNSTDGSNNTDWFGSPTITVIKLSVVISDPFNGGSNPKRIPGAVIEYSITPSNTGDGSPDADSTYVTDIIGTNGVTFDVTTGVIFTNGTTSSALTLGTVTYSDDAFPGPYTYDYTPVPDGDGYDSNITSIKATTTGTFANGGAPAPSFTLKYRVKVK